MEIREVRAAELPALVRMAQQLFCETDYRKQKVASELVRAREKGCTEIASDAECENVLSHTFHKKVGYHMISKTVHFIKELERESE